MRSAARWRSAARASAALVAALAAWLGMLAGPALARDARSAPSARELWGQYPLGMPTAPSSGAAPAALDPVRPRPAASRTAGSRSGTRSALLLAVLAVVTALAAVASAGALTINIRWRRPRPAAPTAGPGPPAPPVTELRPRSADPPKRLPMPALMESLAAAGRRAVEPGRAWYAKRFAWAPAADAELEAGPFAAPRLLVRGPAWPREAEEHGRGARLRHLDRRTAAGLAFVVLAVLVTHGVNFLHYPYLEADEGTYFSQGWAVLHQWRLSPYTYFYDHAPLGWIQIALWQLATFDARFGYGLASGRVLMLLFQLGSALLVYGIAWRASGRHWVALLAACAFTLSTYGIHYHRRILLDNVVTFWLLLSIFMLVGRPALRALWLSALALGVAVLSKEIAVAAIPALAVLAARRAPRESRVFATVGWLAIVLAVGSIYPLTALLKGEFFPAGTPLGGDHRHVSLLCSLMWQSSRQSDGGLLDPSSAFWVSATKWAHDEPLLVLGGTACALVAAVGFRRHAVLSMLGWTTLSLWLFVGRGGVVLDFYLVPLLPLLALLVALVAHRAVAALRPYAGVAVAGTVTALALVTTVGLNGLAYARSDRGLWTQRPVDGQVQAAEWIRGHLPPGSRMVIDMSMWTDLHLPPTSSPAFPNAHYYWRIGQDPDLRRAAFRDDWRTAEYVIATPQMLSDTTRNRFPIVAAALENSRSVKRFDGGWPIDVRKVDPNGHQVPPGPSDRSAGCMASDS